MLFYFVTCRRQCRFLASQIALHQCNHVLRQIKAAAAAQRGYLLDDAWMPPIGRLEANENAPHLSCVFLRQTLHAIYMSIAHSNSSGHLPPLPLAHHEPQASRHPSLLLMALSHQHNATMQFLDQALAALSFDDDQSLAHVLREVALWVDRLQQATAVLDDATKQVDLVVDHPEVVQASRTSATTTTPSSSSRHHLQQQKMLGNTLKTAVAVLFAADSRVDDPETTRQCVARVGELLAAATATWTKWQAGVVKPTLHSARVRAVVHGRRRRRRSSVRMPQILLNVTQCSLPSAATVTAKQFKLFVKFVQAVAGNRRIEGRGALHIACYHGNIDMVNLLLTQGADAHLMSMEEVSLLHADNSHTHPTSQLSNLPPDAHFDPRSAGITCSNSLSRPAHSLELKHRMHPFSIYTKRAQGH
ncbi:hypothetical protein DYB30_002203 [Aphanomyces astaci]|uniref:Uncharacterized protein n=2 Tax=Aphanomyces astaci TaxID=112090 RepID=A0A397D5D9_APHAT|nr:hypothetical protein DYB30_002203 [Aphanomyces astaci]